MVPGNTQYLELPVVELGAVLEEELVRGAEARLNAVFDDGARARRTRQLLDLKSEKKCSDRAGEIALLTAAAAAEVGGNFFISRTAVAHK